MTTPHPPSTFSPLPRNLKDEVLLKELLKEIYDCLCHNNAKIPYKTLPLTKFQSSSNKKQKNLKSQQLSNEQIWAIVEQSLSGAILPNLSDSINKMIQKYAAKLSLAEQDAPEDASDDASDDDQELFTIVPTRSMILFRQSMGLDDYSDDSSSEDEDVVDAKQNSGKKDLLEQDASDKFAYAREEDLETSDEEEDVDELIRKLEEEADMIEDIQDKKPTEDDEIAEDALYGEIDVDNIEESYGVLPDGEDSEIDEGLLDEYEQELREAGLYNDDSSLDDYFDEEDGELGDDDMLGANEAMDMYDNEDEDDIGSELTKKKGTAKSAANSNTTTDKPETEEIDETEFEKYESKLIEQMEQLENENLKEKSWQESGEVTAKKREQDTLLDEDLSFEHAAKANPVIDDQHNDDLESLIIHRIMENIFDDPKRKLDENDKDDVKKIHVSAERDRKSLAELYEKKYLETVHGIEAEENNEEAIKLNEVKADIKNKVSKVLRTLNAMSSFHYVAPPTKYVGTDKVDTSKAAPQAAVMREDTSNLLRSEALEATPGEIMTSLPYLSVGETEMTKQDRKRKRRLAKHVAQKKAKMTKELVDKLNPSKNVSASQQKELLSSLKTIEEDKDTQKYTKSKDFFTMLQENMEKKSNQKKADQIQNQHDKEKSKTRQQARYNRL